MNIQEVRELARDYNIKTAKVSKMKLIQEIQISEGNFNCFASAYDSECDQIDCTWRDDCFTAAKKLHS